ncbi:cache domain-containing protein [Desulfovulcanus sp.]
MSLKKRFMIIGTLFSLALIACLICKEICSFNNFEQQTMLELAHQKQFRYQQLMDVLQEQALRQAALFALLPDVIDSFELAHQGDINREDDPYLQKAREEIRKILRNNLISFQNITGQKFQLHYHLPNGRSLVRLWRKKQTKRNGVWVDVSDDISSFRQTVLDVNRLGKPIVGIEIGRGGFVVRGLAPVKKDGRQLGSVEVLLSFDPVLSASRNEKAIFLLMNKDKLSVARKLHGRPEIGDFVIVKGEHIELLDNLDQSFLMRAKEGLQTRLDGKNFYMGFPVRDYNGKQIGVLLTVITSVRLKIFQ